MPSNLQDSLKKVEAYYLAEATRTAAFSFGCSQDQAEAAILSTSREEFQITEVTWTESASYLLDDRISTIGVTACQKRATYKVLCGVKEEYAAPVFEYAMKNAEKRGPCKVVAEGGSAQGAAARDNDERAKLLEEQEEKGKQDDERRRRSDEGKRKE